MEYTKETSTGDDSHILLTKMYDYNTTVAVQTTRRLALRNSVCVSKQIERLYAQNMTESFLSKYYELYC